MVREVWLESATWNDLPYRFEAGTPNIADVIAWGAAVDYLQEIGLDNVREHEVAITQYALERFMELGEDVDVFGPRNPAERGGVISFSVPGLHAHDLGTFLDLRGIAVRVGHHCAMPLMRHLGVPATTRASFYLYNTEGEVDILLDGLHEAFRYFRRA